MIERKDILVDGSSYQLSLSKLVGKKVVDVTFYVSEYDGELCMKACDILFEDGSEMGIEAEQDFPYLTIYPKWEMPNTEVDTLQSLANN